MSRFVGLSVGLLMFVGLAQAADAPKSVSGNWDAWLAQRKDTASLKVRWSADRSQVRSVRGILLTADGELNQDRRVAALVDQVLTLQGMSRENLGTSRMDGTRNRKAFHFPQLFAGIPVEGRSLVLTVRKDGAVVSLENNLARFSEPMTPLVLSAEEARMRALDAMKASDQGQHVKAAPAKVILPVANTPVQVWRVPVAALPHGLYSVYVRGDDGRILWVRNQMIH